MLPMTREWVAKAQSDYSALQARAAATATIVKIYEANARNLEEKGLTHQDLTRAAKTSEENYLLYLRKQEEARMADALDEGRIFNVAVAESPNVPLVPTNSPWMLGMVGVLLSATVSLGIVFTVEYMDSSFRTPSEVISELNIPVLASVPRRYNGNGHSNGSGNGRKGHNSGTGSEVDDYVQQR